MVIFEIKSPFNLHLEPEFFTGSPVGEEREDYFIRLCMVVDWCIDRPEYTAKIKVIPKKDYPIRFNSKNVGMATRQDN